MPWFAHWKSERAATRKADAFVEALFREPAQDDIAWLATAATRGDADHAVWELRYARRALGLIAAQRDALDDSTASNVARAMTAALAHDANIAADMVLTSERQFNARLSAYRDGLAAKGGAPTLVLMGQTLIAFAGGSFRQRDANVVHAGELMTKYLAEANEALREVFGTASLPENVRPSAMVTNLSDSTRQSERHR